MSPRIWHWILSLYSHQAMRKMSSQIWHWILSLHPFFFLDFPLAPFSLLWRILNLLFIIIHYFPPAPFSLLCRILNLFFIIIHYFPLAPFSSICRILNLYKWAVLLHFSEVIRYCFYRQARVKEKIENKMQAGTEGFLILAWDKLSENFPHHIFIHTHFTTLSLSGFCAYTERSADLSLRAMIDRSESFEVLTVWSCKPQI